MLEWTRLLLVFDMSENIGSLDTVKC